MTIRPYSPADLPAVLEVYARSKLDELALEPRVPELVPLDRDAPRFARFRRSTVHVHADPQVTGFASHLGNEITGLFVRPDARGRGVGRALLEHLLDSIDGPCLLHVAASNRPAITLYRRYGFAPSAAFTADYNGLPVEALTLRRPGSSPSPAAGCAAGDGGAHASAAPCGTPPVSHIHRDRAP